MGATRVTQSKTLACFSRVLYYVQVEGTIHPSLDVAHIPWGNFTKLRHDGEGRSFRRVRISFTAWVMTGVRKRPSAMLESESLMLIEREVRAAMPLRQRYPTKRVIGPPVIRTQESPELEFSLGHLDNFPLSIALVHSSSVQNSISGISPLGTLSTNFPPTIFGNPILLFPLYISFT